MIDEDNEDDFETVVVAGHRMRILKDGHRMRVPMQMADAFPRNVRLHDGHGATAGQRPGFVHSTDAALSDAKKRAYDSYEDHLINAWRDPSAAAGPREFVVQREGEVSRVDGRPSCVPDHLRNAAFSAADARAIKDAAYQEYEDRVANAWRGRPQ